MAEGLPLFCPAALAVLDRIPFDPAARGRFELMSGGLMWPDEFPSGGSVEWELVRPHWVYRYLIAYRRALTLGEVCEEFRSVWEQVTRQAPNWPGLRPERRGERAARRLRAALRGQDKCLAEFEAHLGVGSPDAAADGKPLTPPPSPAPAAGPSSPPPRPATAPPAPSPPTAGPGRRIAP